MRQSRLSRFVSLALVLVAGCGGAGGDITLGAAGPWQATFGQMNRRGIELAVAELNALPEFQGRQVKVEFRDDQGDGARAAAIAAEFVANPAIAAVVGHVTSGAMVAAARVYDGNLAAVATSASAPVLSGISPWTFRVIPSDLANARTLATFASARGLKRAAILYENSSYGRGLTEAFRSAYAGTVVSADPIFEGDQPMEPWVTHLRRQAPDLVFVAGTEASGLAFLREARRQELRATFLGSDGWTGVASDPVASEGALVGTTFSANDTRAEARRFVDAFRARFGMEPDAFAALAYDATRLVADAVRRADGDRERVRELLAEGTSFSGVTGALQFDAQGDPTGQRFLVTRVNNGRLEPVEGSR